MAEVAGKVPAAGSPAGVTDDEEAWEQWWGVQDALCRAIGQHLDEAGAGRSDQFRAALVASLIEHLAERQRAYLHLPAADVKEETSG